MQRLTRMGVVKPRLAVDTMVMVVAAEFVAGELADMVGGSRLKALVLLGGIVVLLVFV